jgi:imidazolonepropionase-like amidohydrolase
MYKLFGKETDYTQGIANGPDALREAARFQVKYGADVIKFCASGGVLSLADEVDTPQLTLAESATSVDAELLGITQKVGTLEKGKLADVIAMPGDPTGDIAVTERIYFVLLSPL